ncbi:hypothetical protein [Nonomuraea africana]|uniref:Uncharacterized protein n=1 Tax=Nonomuraea africana TaxID=46171 RepID=A0ABR9KJD4_9ACTN|nr:hypothetical protein [Nonomuraea africana]MBE1562131.1 hypothetical protein [Nonomuraea africana]
MHGLTRSGLGRRLAVTVSALLVMSFLHGVVASPGAQADELPKIPAAEKPLSGAMRGSRSEEPRRHQAARHQLGYDNAAISFDGRAGELIPAGNDTWKIKGDDGTKVEHLEGSNRDNGDNCDNNQGYWKVTTGQSMATPPSPSPAKPQIPSIIRTTRYAGRWAWITGRLADSLRPGDP